MDSIKPKNLSAQLAYRARGNPPSTLPASAISNCFPGLEFDFRNLWKNLFVGVELHEAGLGRLGHFVLAVDPGSAAEAAGVRPFDNLLAIDGRPVTQPHVAPEGATNRRATTELANLVADLAGRAGETVRCTFEASQLVPDPGRRVEAELEVRSFFDGAALSEELAEPGAMTQGLCSPWQADYRECGCYYWAASRPDFVNVEGDDGHDWMQRDRGPDAPYRPDPGSGSPDHVSYDDLYTAWERHLGFIVGGKDVDE